MSALRSLFPACCFLVLIAFALAVPTLAQGASAEAESAESTVTEEAIEAVIATLEDEGRRERLVNDLAVILEARRASAAQQAAESTDVLAWLEEQALTLWQSVLAVNPVDLAISLGLSLSILIGALVFRALVMRLMERLFNRISTGDDDAAPPEAGDDSAAEPVEVAEMTVEEKDCVEESDELGGTAKEPQVLPAMVPRTVNLLVVITALVLLAGSWGADLGAIFASETGAHLVEMLFSVGLIVVVSAILWQAAEAVVRRVLNLYSRAMDAQRRERRVSTLVPLISTSLRAALGTIATLLVLSELGINIGPLLAGAGILGLAVGFGAQTLVRDLITGVIILMEDSASAGDIVETGNHIGVVEEMRMRVMQLRDVRGIVHIIPYSDVTWIKNHSMEFSYYVFDVGVAYRENTDEVIDVLTKLGREFEKDRAFRDLILSPLEIMGVDAFADSAVIVKARYRTAPGQQWTVGRAFNARIKKRFDELDIEIPFPHTTLYFGAPKEGAAPPLPLPANAGAAIAGGGPLER